MFVNETDELTMVVVVAPGDREHIPESDKPAFHILSEHLQRLRQTTPVSTFFSLLSSINPDVFCMPSLSKNAMSMIWSAGSDRCSTH